MASVGRLTVSHVRGCAVVPRDELRLERDGVRENRRFVLVDANGRRVTLSREGALACVRTDYDPDADRLTLRFPDRTEVAGTIETDGAVDVEFAGGRVVPGRRVDGPWADALSRHVGYDVQLVQLAPGAAHTPDSVASLISTASIGEFDPRRFRIMIALDGCRAYEEEEWRGRSVRVGEATLRVTDPIPRCVATKRNPDSGEIDVDTLGALQARRGSVDLGVAAAVVEPGVVRLGDALEVLA